MISTLQSIWTWFAITLLMIIWMPLLAVARLFDRDPARYHTGRWFRRLGAMMTYVNPSWRIQVLGEPPENPRNPYVVVSNHLSSADIPIVSRLPWEMKWVAKAEVFKVPMLGWMMRQAGDIPVDRTSKRSRAMVLFAARDYLDKPCSVMFFPEGTRSRTGQTMRFNDGPFRLAIKAQVPVLPLVIDGTQDALPKNNWRFGRAEHIRLKVLPPVPTAGLKASDTAVLREQVRHLIMTQLAEWRGVPVEATDGLRAAGDGLDDKNSAKTTAPAS